MKSDPMMLERIGRATLDAVQYIRNPANKKSVLQIMAKNLKLSKPDKIEQSYNDLVEELPRSICPTVPGVRTVMKFMADLGLNPKAAQMKTDEVVDLTLCKRLGGSGS